jgi:hypothetical protein
MLYATHHRRDQSGRRLLCLGCRSARRDSRIVSYLRLLKASLRPCCVCFVVVFNWRIAREVAQRSVCVVLAYTICDTR